MRPPSHATPPPAPAPATRRTTRPSRAGSQREPGEEKTSYPSVDPYEDSNGRSSGGRLLDEFLVEDPDDEEPAGRRASSQEGQDDEENMSVWRPGRWIGN